MGQHDSPDVCHGMIKGKTTKHNQSHGSIGTQFCFIQHSPDTKLAQWVMLDCMWHHMKRKPRCVIRIKCAALLGSVSMASGTLAIFHPLPKSKVDINLGSWNIWRKCLQGTIHRIPDGCCMSNRNHNLQISIKDDERLHVCPESPLHSGSLAIKLHSLSTQISIHPNASTSVTPPQAEGTSWMAATKQDHDGASYFTLQTNIAMVSWTIYWWFIDDDFPVFNIFVVLYTC